MIIKNTYFAAIKDAMSEGNANKWVLYHKTHSICSYSRYYEPHLNDYDLINSKMIRSNPLQRWHSTIDITDIFLNSSMDLSVAGGIIASRLEIIPPIGLESVDLEKQEIIIEFRNISESSDSGPTDKELENFDAVLERLYNWGDTRVGPKRICHVKAFGK